MALFRKILLAYFCGISLCAAVLCIYDKIAAKRRPRRRIRERTLIFVSVFGGAPAMFLAMQLARHKTRHMKIIVAVALFALLWAGVYLYVLFRFELVWQVVTALF